MAGAECQSCFYFRETCCFNFRRIRSPPESDYLKGGYNGEWSENKSVLSDSIEKVLNNINFYSDNALKSGDELSIDSMVQGFKDAVDYAQKERG